MAHIMVCTPMYGGLCHGGYTQALLELQQLFNKEGHKMDFSYLSNESLIQRGRNTLAWFFLEKSQATHLMFIDADIEFNPLDIIKMIDADVDVIGGIYPKKTINWKSVKNAIADNIDTSELERYSGDFVFRPLEGTAKIYFNNPLETDLIGTGFMLIKRQVLEDLKEHVGSYISNNATEDRNSVTYNFFQVTVENNELLSEDYFFCRVVRRAGKKIYSAPWANFVHNGNYRFRGSFRDFVILTDRTNMKAKES